MTEPPSPLRMLLFPTYKAPRVHHAARRRGGCVAARGAGAAAGDAGDRIPEQRSPLTNGQLVAAFRQGLSEAGYVEGRNVAIEFRWADGQLGQLPALAADLVALAGRGDCCGRRAQLTTCGEERHLDDPDRPGAVATRSARLRRKPQPAGGNVTGLTLLSYAASGKRLELLQPDGSASDKQSPTFPAPSQLVDVRGGHGSRYSRPRSGARA